MGLRKASEPAGLRRIEPREFPRDGQGLIEQLQSDDAGVRRWAARDLADHPEAVGALCAQLVDEPDNSVREVAFTSLSRIGGTSVVDGLLPLLRSEDANLRNSAIEVLSGLPEAVGPRINALLKDADADVRIFTVNLLGQLRHPDVASWIAAVLMEDDHVNVVAAAIEVLAEVGSRHGLQALKEARKRFADNPFIVFSAELAEQRIEAP